MNAYLQGERTLTSLDHARLEALLRRTATAATRGAPLTDLLDEAELVPSRAVDPTIVTMYSRVLLADTADGDRRALTLCYPADADVHADLVSVLSPIGSSLLGRRVGDVAHWLTPPGKMLGAEVIAILFQPEASGNYTL